MHPNPIAIAREQETSSRRRKILRICLQGSLARIVFYSVVGALSLVSPGDVRAQLDLNPTRPTIANSVGIQNKGVLQGEIGYDGFPQRVPVNQQSVSTLLSYVPLERLRLDFGWSPYDHQQANGMSTNSVGTIQAGGKAVLWKENYHHAAPGLALQYEAEFPTASSETSQNLGQQFIVLLNHHYGRSGILDVIVNGSLVQSDCQTATKCTYGGQQSFALSYHLHEDTRLYAEVFGQNNSESNVPPGTYVFGGFYQKVSDAFGIDGGMRFGVSDHAASVGVTVGIVFGKRLLLDSRPKAQIGPDPAPVRQTQPSLLQSKR